MQLATFSTDLRDVFDVSDVSDVLDFFEARSILYDPGPPRPGARCGGEGCVWVEVVRVWEEGEWVCVWGVGGGGWGVVFGPPAPGASCWWSLMRCSQMVPPYTWEQSARALMADDHVRPWMTFVAMAMHAIHGWPSWPPSS